MPTTFLLLLIFLLPLSNSLPLPPPLPLLPIPSSHQLRHYQTPLSIFLHFGPNTFTNSEWGTGSANPSQFNPTRLNTNQWAHIAQSTGFSRLILTAKHHDGFCLWPSGYTDYSVKSSAWRNGSGDVVGELAKSVREFGVELGLYLSPWDRHENCYGETREYNQFYLAQLTELLTRYGDIGEMFLDGAKGEGEKDMEYFFDVWFDLIHQLQPKALIFSDDGPDLRWVGDEAGVAGTTCWSLFNTSASKIGDTNTQYQIEGDPLGQDWVPAQCDVSIRPGWFWHASESPKSALTLLDIYYKSVGRNCLLLLNVPPNSSGLISPEDIQVLQEFSDLRNTIFSNNLAKNAIITASNTRGVQNSEFDASYITEQNIYTYWAPEEDQSDWKVYVDLKEKVNFNVLQLEEPIQMGQRVVSFHVDVLNENGEWYRIADGTTIGYKRFLVFPKVESRYLRLIIEKSRADPLISFLGIHMDPYSDFTSDGSIMLKGATLVNEFKHVIRNPTPLWRKFLGYQM